MAVTKQPRHAKTQPGPGYPTFILGVSAVDQPSRSLSHLPSIPGYEIIRLIDQGGMSNIYLAKQKGLGRLVAVKMIRPQDALDSQSAQAVHSRSLVHRPIAASKRCANSRNR